MYRILFIVLFLTLNVVSSFASTHISLAVIDSVTISTGEVLTSIFQHFISEYKELGISKFDYSYAVNLNHIQDLNGIKRQTDFFEKYRDLLLGIHRDDLNNDLRYQYDALTYEITFNLERLDLEKQFRENHSTVTQGGLFRLENSKRWYALYIKQWTSTDMTPEDIFNFGVSEVIRTASEFREIQEQLGYGGKDEEFYSYLNEASFFITDETELQRALFTARDTAQRNLSRLFEFTDIPVVGIQPVPNPTNDTPPGYYVRDAGTFYYNFYAHRFPKRTLDWLFLHEAVPGHHYQYSSGEVSQAPISKLFWYPGYTEGWGAYVENLGQDLGFYQDPYQLLGKWEWDMVRSIRLSIDVGIHYKGWSRDQALQFWHQYIPHQDAIAEREVDRIIRWPVQVMSYKLGERQFLNLKRYCQEQQGSHFDLRRFHTAVLSRGSIPLPILGEIIFDVCRD